MAIDATSLATIKLYLGQTGCDASAWDDDEIQTAWNDNSYDTHLAAATLFEVAAGSAAKCAILSKLGGDTLDARQIPQWLLETASRFRMGHKISPQIFSNDAIATISNSAGTVIGTIDNW